MRKIFFSTIFFLLSITSFVPKTYAHILATDKNIGAVLHINPNDDPIANTPTSFFFEFKDKTNKFTPLNCDCTFIVLENGKQIYSQPLFQDNQNPNLENASLTYTFPQSDVYEIHITGKPLTPSGFQTFLLTWNIRAEKGNTSLNPTQTNTSFFAQYLLHFIIISLALFLFLMLYIYQRIHTSQNK